MKKNFKKLQQIGCGNERGVGMLLVRNTAAKETQTSIAMSNAGPDDLEMIVGAAITETVKLWIEAEAGAGKKNCKSNLTIKLEFLHNIQAMEDLLESFSN